MKPILDPEIRIQQREAVALPLFQDSCMEDAEVATPQGCLIAPVAQMPQERHAGCEGAGRASGPLREFASASTPVSPSAGGAGNPRSAPLQVSCGTVEGHGSDRICAEEVADIPASAKCDAAVSTQASPAGITDKARARRNDPETSKAAARSIGNFADNHCRLIYEAIRQFGPMGKTRIAQKAGIDHVAVGKRLPDLQRCGVAYPTDKTEKSGSGRQERIWRLA